MTPDNLKREPIPDNVFDGENPDKNALRLETEAICSGERGALIGAEEVTEVAAAKKGQSASRSTKFSAVSSGL